jgi:LPS-assembly lipoprotein
MNATGRQAGKERRVTRRGLLAVLPTAVALVLGGCGWHSPYAPSAEGQAGPGRTGLGLVNIPVVPERAGQELREALQARFDHGDAPVAKKYDLTINYGVGTEGLGIQPDNSTTRIRIIGNVSWALVTRDARRATVTSGQARVVDGLNPFNEQYFAQDLETEAVIRRVSEALAEKITADLALWFDKHPA